MFTAINGNDDRAIHTGRILPPASKLDAMPVSQQTDRARSLSIFLFIIPPEGIAQYLSKLFNPFSRQATQHGKHRTAQDQIIQMLDLFMQCKKSDLAMCIFRQGLKRLIGSSFDEGSNAFVP